MDLNGIDGLIHISELSWSHVNHPSEILSIGDTVAVKVLDIDRERQRISLGLKQTQEDPWQRVVDTYNVGDELEGTVTKVVTFGAFVEILDGVEGLVHISELAPHHVENPREIVSPGDDVKVKILEIDSERRRLSLSVKRVEGQVLDAEGPAAGGAGRGRRRPRRPARARPQRGRVRRGRRRLGPGAARGGAATDELAAEPPDVAAEPPDAAAEPPDVAEIAAEPPDAAAEPPAERRPRAARHRRDRCGAARRGCRAARRRAAGRRAARRGVAGRAGLEAEVGRVPFVGLTGGMGAGKSTALEVLERLGAATLSTDSVVHELYATDEVRDLVVARWGDEVAPAGVIDRPAIAKHVFAEPDERAWLEGELWPRVGARVAAWRDDVSRREPPPAAAVVETPLMFEAGMDAIYDATIAVVADEQVRAERAAARGHVAHGERAARQLSQDEKARRATYVVHNSATVDDLERQLSDVLARLSSP